MKPLLTFTVILIVSTNLIGCTSEKNSTTSNRSLDQPDVAAVDGSAYLLSAEPKEPASVIRVREDAANDDVRSDVICEYLFHSMHGIYDSFIDDLSFACALRLQVMLRLWRYHLST